MGAAAAAVMRRVGECAAAPLRRRASRGGGASTKGRHGKPGRMILCRVCNGVARSPKGGEPVAPGVIKIYGKKRMMIPLIRLSLSLLNELSAC
jgi:hypothetical protein